MSESFFEAISKQLDQLKEEGLYKSERVIASCQGPEITLESGQRVVNFCANNYLGLAGHPFLSQKAKEQLDLRGFGTSSVRFICGTFDVHKQLEQKISSFLKTEETIVYPSCFDANGGLFETFFTKEDAIISDSLNHASIIDGVRLCKAQRFRYANNDLEDLEQKLIAAKDCRYKIIATDGVFSMDGIIANLKGISALAKKYDALLMVDDAHATGFVGENGRGSHEYNDILGQVDIITGTLGKALGGASGGYTSGRKEIVNWLRQRSRPYLFSNALAPSIAGTSIAVFDYLEEHGKELRETLNENTRYFRAGLQQIGYELIPGSHPIIPIMIGDAKSASILAAKLLEEGVYVISFSYPVVPKGLARIRTQISAAHTKEHLDKALNSFEKIGKEMGLLQPQPMGV